MASSKVFSVTAWRVMVIALMGTMATAGCRSSQQTSISNPFLSADRVPAPASRIPAQGTATPYYPGQVAPAMPGATQPLQPLGALPPSDDITPIQGDGSLVEGAPLASGALASNESAVQIPSDEGSMRFTPPPVQPAAPVVAASQPVAANAPSMAVAANPGLVTPTPTVFRDNQPPSTAPVINNWPPAPSSSPQVTLNPVSTGGNASGLFRDPAVPAQAPALINESAPQPSVAQPLTAPRARIPGAEEMIREEVVPGTINTTSYQVGMAGGVQGDPIVIPPPGYVPSSFEPAAPTAPASDAFVPRGTSRGQSEDGFSQPGIPTIRVTPG